MNPDTRGPRITAHSFFKEMRSYGYTSKQIIRIINELLELVTTSVREERRTPSVAEARVEAGRGPLDVR
ncbi:hypothetical protein JQX13_20165 [Archangium violaceum]|uniref:hypothetical protein n=1 Tax=Archangium violaceum TaxID=83451 RepID=UPI00193B0163|nr:hypothetical protein [Archangium violaceum]QRK12148.1 hypothetical protein JQX13_20165 [Archangium violaceum]